MGRHVKVPLFILKSKLCANAKLLWMELACLSSKKRPLVSVNASELAQSMGLSPRTIQRLINELIKSELLIQKGYVNRRLKLVEVVRMPCAQPSRHCEERSDAAIQDSVDCFSAKALRNDENERFRKKSHDEPHDLTPAILDKWVRDYPALDGRSGRPNIVDCMQRAVEDPKRDKTQSMKIWVEAAIRLESRKHYDNYIFEKYPLYDTRDKAFSDKGVNKS